MRLHMQLVGGPKNVDLFVILGVFLFKVSSSFFTVSSIDIFAMKFNEKETR